MGKYSILTVDLNETSDEERNAFGAELKEMHWEKDALLTTLWYAKSGSGQKEPELLRVAERQVKHALESVGIKKYEVVIAVSSSKPRSFKMA